MTPPSPYEQRGVPQYGQYAPPGYQHQTPIPTGWSTPWTPPSLGESHAFSWRSFGQNAGVWIAMVLLLGVVSMGLFVVVNPWYLESVQAGLDGAATGDEAAPLRMQEDLMQQMGTMTSFVSNTLLGLVSQILTMTLYAGALASTRKRRIGFGDFFALRNWGSIVLYALIMTLVSLVTGLIPVIGLFAQLAVSIFMLAAPYYILGHNLNALEAIAASAKLVASNFGVVILAWLVVVGYTIAGVCACGLGLLAAVPFSAVVGAHLFRRLQGESIEADQNPMAA